MALIKVLSKAEGTFIGTDGKEHTYFWYDAVRLSDDTVIHFGSKTGTYELGNEYDLMLGKFERTERGKDGKSKFVTYYKEMQINKTS